MKSLNERFIDMLRVPSTSKIFLLQNLSIMAKTGIPLADGLKALNEQMKNKKLKKILLDVSDQIRQGKSFGESLEPYQKDFGEMFINMVKAGEVSGRLEEVLKELYLQHKKDHELKMKVRNALIYPSIIIIAMIGIGIFLIIFVLPNLASMFKELNVALPLPTRILIGTNDFMQSNGLWVATALIILIAAFIKGINTKKGKYILDSFLLKVPILSGIIKKISLAKIARSISALIKTDISIVNTLEITSRIVGNAQYKKAMVASAEQVKKGDKLEVIFRGFPALFPPTIIQMISVGEETGALDEIMVDLADFYEEDVKQTMESLPTIIEPVLMLVLAGGVAVIALAIMMPMYSLTEAF